MKKLKVSFFRQAENPNKELTEIELTAVDWPTKEGDREWLYTARDEDRVYEVWIEEEEVAVEGGVQ